MKTLSLNVAQHCATKLEPLLPVVACRWRHQATDSVITPLIFQGGLLGFDFGSGETKSRPVNRRVGPFVNRPPAQQQHHQVRGARQGPFFSS
jgi:hypothetical protein